MPNPVPRKYTVQLAPTFTPDTAGELAAWAEVQGRSVSEVTRECTERGLEIMRQEYAFNHGPLGAVRLGVHIEAAAQRGEKQAARRSATDRDTRAAAARVAAVPPKRRRRSAA